MPSRIKVEIKSVLREWNTVTHIMKLLINIWHITNVIPINLCKLLYDIYNATPKMIDYLHFQP